MPLPKKAEKEYLEISPRNDGFGISAEPQHAAELEALFQQHHINCRVDSNGPEERAVLSFAPQADREKAQEILDAYRHAKGS
jgi:hypothetical protein